MGGEILAFFRGSEPPAGQSVTHSIEDLAQDTGPLVQLAIALLKQETIELVKRNVLAAGILAGAGLCALLTLTSTASFPQLPLLPALIGLLLGIAGALRPATSTCVPAPPGEE